jgi:hypothetical protein
MRESPLPFNFEHILEDLVQHVKHTAYHLGVATLNSNPGGASPTRAPTNDTAQ